MRTARAVRKTALNGNLVEPRSARSPNALLLFRMTDPEMRRALYADLERHLEQVEKSSERFGGRRP